ncbi:MAG: tRNA pseudouridine(55) synthase TruB [Bacteroidota bacterium]|nr:tRNA pseudouridine(55) synthase TruB [Bacteroidota bacterium]
MSFRLEEGEIIPVNKPYRWTSFDVVNYVRNIARSQLHIPRLKIGHAGTLDPLATGLLILCTGKMTKNIDQFQELEKEYTGTFKFGATTPSFDLEKEIDQTYPWQHIKQSDLEEVAKKFTGRYLQVPPAFSAIKIGGKRAYKYARNEEEVDLQPKEVNISVFELTRIELPEVDFRIVCSKGTYIRALARDYGRMLRSGAHLTALCRTRIGPLFLKDAWEPEDLKKELMPE